MVDDEVVLDTYPISQPISLILTEYHTRGLPSTPLVREYKKKASQTVRQSSSTSDTKFCRFAIILDMGKSSWRFFNAI